MVPLIFLLSDSDYKICIFQILSSLRGKAQITMPSKLSTTAAHLAMPHLFKGPQKKSEFRSAMVKSRFRVHLKQQFLRQTSATIINRGKF